MTLKIKGGNMANNGSARSFNPHKWKVALPIVIIVLIVVSTDIILLKFSTSTPSYGEEENFIPIYSVTHIAKGIVIEKEDSIWEEESEIVYMANVTFLVHKYVLHDGWYVPSLIRLNCEFHYPIEDYSQGMPGMSVIICPSPFNTIPFRVDMPYKFQLQYVPENQTRILWDYMTDGWGYV
ncbi:MAG: hypothetical protein ACUVWK_01010 [Nitrososphaerales archaeon]